MAKNNIHNFHMELDANLNHPGYYRFKFYFDIGGRRFAFEQDKHKDEIKDILEALEDEKIQHQD